MLPEALRQKPELVWARRLVWVYFWLLLFEGALRKWFFPGLSNPLLVIRDPVVLGIYFLAASRRSFPANGFIVFSAVLAVILGFVAMLFGHGNFLVALYGLRTNFLHLPLIFVIPHLFSLDDVRAFGRALMWVSLPMSALVVMQFMLPAKHLLNIAAGGTHTQMLGALGHVRPAGTFSFGVGTTCFMSLQCAFIAAAFFDRTSRVLRTLSLVALIFALACSLSRGAVLACAVVVAGAVWAFFLAPSRINRGLVFVGSLLLLVVAASFTPVFQWGATILGTRFEDADLEHTATLSLFERLRNDLLEPFGTLRTVSLSGAGTGAGTNVGAALLTGARGFPLGELEWTRLMLESGLLLGPFVIGLRVALCLYFLYWGYVSLKKADNPLPWLLCFSLFPWVFNGSWGQPTVLGFASLGAGLLLAATRKSYEDHPLLRALKHRGA